MSSEDKFKRSSRAKGCFSVRCLNTLSYFDGVVFQVDPPRPVERPLGAAEVDLGQGRLVTAMLEKWRLVPDFAKVVGHLARKEENKNLAASVRLSLI